MSFLLRRNLPKAWAGWHDVDGTNNRPDESTIQRPWGIWGAYDTGVVKLISNNIVMDALPAVTGTQGGVSYEHGAYTPNWGCDFALKGYPTGTLAQPFLCFMSASWAKVNPDVNNLLKIEWQYRNPAVVGSHQLRMLKFTNPLANGDPIYSTTFTQNMFDGNWHDHRILVEGDRHVRIYLDGVLRLQGALPVEMMLGTSRRSVNFQNGTNANGFTMANFKLYDRQPDLYFYSTTWGSPFFSDDFNRANGAVGNGWTQLGSNASIVNNSWSTTTTNDGNRAIIRDTGITNGYQRIEGVVGGNIGPNNTKDSGLMLCCNAAGTQGLSLNIYSGAIYIARFSSSLSGATISFTDLASITSGLSIASGDTIAFCVRNGVAWAEINGTPYLYATNVHSVVPASNSWSGGRVGRASFNNSNSWNSIALKTAA